MSVRLILRLALVLFVLLGALPIAGSPQTAAAAPSLKSISISPSSIAGGNQVKATITLTSRAPSGGTLVTLKSNRPSLLQPVANWTVAAGRTTATLTMSTLAGVSRSTVVTITAKLGSVTKTATVTLVPPALTKLYVNSKIQSGQAGYGKLYLNGKAPSGLTIALKSNRPSMVMVPATVTFPRGTSAVQFPITTKTIRADTVVTITATYGGVKTSAQTTILLTIPPDPDVLTFRVLPRPLPPGGMDEEVVTDFATLSPNGSVTIEACRAAAPATDTTYTLGSTAPADAAPAVSELTFAAGTARCRTVQMTAGSVGPGTARLSATLGDRSWLSGAITVIDRTFTVSLAHATVLTGHTVSMTVAINQPHAAGLCVPIAIRPTGGAWNPISEALPCVYLGPGASSVALPVSRSAAGSYEIGLFPVGEWSATQTPASTVSLTVVTVDLVAVHAAGPVKVGASTTGYVELSAAAPIDVSVTIREISGSRLTLPQTVTVPAGETRSADVAIGTKQPGTATIEAQLGDTTRSATLVVQPPEVTLVSLPPALRSNETLQGQVTLDVAAPAGGTVVSLTSSDPSVATVPASVTVPAGQTAAHFDITGVSPGTAAISAGVPGSAMKTAIIGVDQVSISAVTLDNPTVPVGMTASGMVHLTGVVDEDTVVTLTSSDPTVATVNSSVTVPDGQMSASIEVTPLTPGTVTITAELNGASATAQLTVAGPRVSSVSAQTVTLRETHSISVTVQLTTSVSEDTIVTLSSSAPSIVGVPLTVTVPAGTASATFTAQGLAAGLSTITATLDGSSASAIYDVSPIGAYISRRLSGSTFSVGFSGPLVRVCLTEPPGRNVTITIGTTTPGVIELSTTTLTVDAETGATCGNSDVYGTAISPGSTGIWIDATGGGASPDYTDNDPPFTVSPNAGAEAPASDASAADETEAPDEATVPEAAPER